MPDAPLKPGWRNGCGCLFALCCPAVGFVIGLVCGTLAGHGDFAIMTGTGVGVIGACIGLVVGLVVLVAFWQPPPDPR